MSWADSQYREEVAAKKGAKAKVKTWETAVRQPSRRTNRKALRLE